MSIPIKAQLIHCSSLECPEHRSLCCNAKPKILQLGKSVRGIRIICSVCGDSYQGGECTSDTSAQSGKSAQLLRVLTDLVIEIYRLKRWKNDDGDLPDTESEKWCDEMWEKLKKL